MDKINGAVFKEMLISGCNNLNNRKKEVDSLNVFPVPDGDTGTNISDMFNKTRGDFAYALLDLDSPVTQDIVDKLNPIEEVVRIRVVK